MQLGSVSQSSAADVPVAPEAVARQLVAFSVALDLPQIARQLISILLLLLGIVPVIKTK